jgi:MarR family transcriptional regulator, organic hydroperoxide resistance regulator
MFDLGQYLPYLINRAGARLAVAFGQELRRHGVTLQEWRVMAALAAQGAQRLSDLAALTSIELSTLSRLIGRMQRSGLLSRDRANGDRREISLKLTAKGTRLTRTIILTAKQYERLSLRGISKAEEAQLKRLLVQVYANIGTLPADT